MSEWRARHMLDAAFAWAKGLKGSYLPLRETNAGLVDNGRLDGLLVPTNIHCDVFSRDGGLGETKPGEPWAKAWTDRLGLIGLEVKASRADFQRGLREGQFERYLPALAGLYVVTGREVKSEEVPRPCGHLVVYEPPGEQKALAWGGTRAIPTGMRCVRKRRAEYKPPTMSTDLMWRVMWDVLEQAREERRAEQQRLNDTMKRVGDLAARRVFSLLSSEVEAGARAAVPTKETDR